MAVLKMLLDVWHHTVLDVETLYESMGLLHLTAAERMVSKGSFGHYFAELLGLPSGQCFPSCQGQVLFVLTSYEILGVFFVSYKILGVFLYRTRF